MPEDRYGLAEFEEEIMQLLIDVAQHGLAELAIAATGLLNAMNFDIVKSTNSNSYIPVWRNRILSNG